MTESDSQKPKAVDNHYAALEAEHFGDPVARTGIYASAYETVGAEYPLVHGLASKTDIIRAINDLNERLARLEPRP